MARRTSSEVYHKIKAEGLLSRLRWDVYATLYRHGPLTQMELCRRMSGKHQDRSLMPRFAELKRMGVIEEVDERKCSVTGVQVLVWDVTDRLPVKLTKPLGYKARVERYLRFADEGLRLASEKIRKECQKDEPTTKLLAVIEYTRGKIREGRAVPTRAKDT